MVSRALVVMCALAGCADDHYECQTDADCDVGEAGRCELDHHCTRFDPSCEDTQRKYTEHSGALTNTCFDDRVVPLDLCAAGQPPALPQGCVGNVCDALPTCCRTGWSDACVEKAQILCTDLKCDTRIALGTRGPRNELWDLRFDGTNWSVLPVVPQKQVLEWLAPGPGEASPHLASADVAQLSIDGAAQAVPSNYNISELRSVDFDRDGRPTLMIGFTNGMGSHIEVRKLDGTGTRTIDTVAIVRMSWGDVDRDGFPDGIAAVNQGPAYQFLKNVPLADHSRVIDDNSGQSVNGGGGANIPPLRSFDWIDENNDLDLDVAAFGFNVNVHRFDTVAIDKTPIARWDCDMPGNFASCNAASQMDASFAGAAYPTVGRSSHPFVLAGQPTRSLWQADLRTGNLVLTPYRLPPSACAVPAGCPFIAVLVRDLDGDHALDVIAIDNQLKVFVAFGGDGDGLDLHEVLTIPTPIPKVSGTAVGFYAVRTSVSGAPIP